MSDRRGQQLLSLDELNRIVLEFLHKKGYSRTEAMLRLESSRATTPQAGSATGVTTGSVALPTPASGPDSYAKTYLMLKEWVEASLDMYQPELSRVLYPLFVHMYLELLDLDEPQMAREFFESFSQDHMLMHGSDLQVLQALRLREHVSENELAQRFVKKRTPLRLSPTAFDLLLHFLHSIEAQGGSTVIRVINQHFEVAVSQGSLTPLGAGSGVDAGAGDEVDPEANKQPVRLGRMPLEPEHHKEVRQMLDYRDKSEPQPDGQPLAPLFEESVKPENDSPAPEVLPRPKFRPVDVDAEIAKIVDAKNRLPMAPTSGQNLGGSLPSVCMYTFHNTYDEINCIEFSRDLSLAAAGFADSYVQLWSLKGDTEPQERLIGHSGAVYGLSFAPDNRTLLSASEDTTVRLWSLDTHTALVAYKGHTEPVWDVTYGPFGHYFATASHDQTARLWSCDHIYPLRIFAGHMSDVDVVEFHPNGTYVFTGSSDKTARMWDVAKGSCVRVFVGHASPVTALAVSPDGRWLATAGEDAVIILWDIGSGRRVKMMRGHGRTSIYSLSFSMGGEVLVSGAADNSVRVWDVKRNTTEDTVDIGVSDTPASTKSSAASTGSNQGSSSAGGSDQTFKRRREIVATTDHLAVFHTKRTPVYTVQFTPRNLVIAGGAFLG